MITKEVRSRPTERSEEEMEAITSALIELKDSLSAITNLQRLMLVLRLRRNPTKFTDLKEILGLKSSAAMAYHLRVLLEEEIVEKKSEGPRHRYSLTPFGKALVDYLTPLIGELRDMAKE